MADHPWLKEANKNPFSNKNSVGLKLAWKQAEDVYQFDTHLKSIFTDKMHDFSLLKPDVLNTLKDITTHFKKCHDSGHHEEMQDPSVQYLHTCSPIGTPRQGNSSLLSLKIDVSDQRALQMKKLPSPSSHVDEKRAFSMDKLLP